MRTIAGELARHLPQGQPVVICSKGLEQATGKLMGEVMAEALPAATQAVLSGPSFAADVARGLPAALTLATADEALGQALATALGYRHLRIYWSSDTVGVQLGGAVKNVLAIAAGIVDGKGLGASAHAALVTRGFAELRRFGEALGARPETLMGLSGLGDLLLTCGSPQSRNMSLGRALGQGKTLQAVLGARRSVAEGVYTAAAVAAHGGGEGHRHADLPGRARHRRRHAFHRRGHRGAAIQAVQGGELSAPHLQRGQMERLEREKRKHLKFPVAEAPAPGEVKPIAPGILWARIPLPFRLNHINVYLIDDGDGWAVLDTGIGNDATRAIWDALTSGPLAGRPLTRLIVTHFHPDHIGLAGWLCERHGLPLLTSQTSYLGCLNISLSPGALDAKTYREFYLRHGLDAETTQRVTTQGHDYLKMVSGLPPTFLRLVAGDTLEHRRAGFDVLTGNGHAPEQVMLYCAADKLFWSPTRC